MNEQRRVLLLILIMTIVVLLVSGISIFWLYQAAFEEGKMRLREIAQSQARFLEAVAEFDAIYSQNYPGGVTAATLSQIRHAHTDFAGLGQTGEFVLAKRDGDMIIFLLNQHHNGLPQPIPFASNLAEPMRRALSGQSGMLVGPDYRGETVLAAYEPVAGLGWGIVAKINLAEIRAPFINAAAVAGLSAVVIVTLGTGLFLRVSNPLLKQLADSEQRFRRMIELAPIGISYVAPDGHFMMVNQYFCDFSGYTRDELLTLTFQDLTHPADLDVELEKMGRFLSGELQTYSIEKCYLHKRNSSAVWVNLTVSLVRQPSGAPEYFICIVEDINERKQAEDALRFNETRLQALYDMGQKEFKTKKELMDYALEEATHLTHSQLGYFHFVREDRINLELFTWPDDISKTFTTANDRYYPLPITGIWADCARRKQPVIHNDYQHLPDKKGYPPDHPHIIRHLSVPIVDANRVVAISGVANKETPYDETDVLQLQLFMDGVWKIIARQQMEEDLWQAKEAAEAANQAKSIFLANMSHELRTPLNAILGFSELITPAPNLTPTQRQNLETINRSGEHLLALINGVLDLSKIEAGRVEVQPEEFDLWRLLANLEEMFRLRAEQKGLNLVFECNPQTPQYIRADQNKLRQVLINLLGNAVKFTRAGTITLRIESMKYEVESKETVRSEEVPSPLPLTPYSKQPVVALRFEVEDTGVGIAPAELDLIFKAFAQTNGNGGQGAQGTGLGLTISRRYARLMGGDLTARSKVGQGSVFVLTMPVAVLVQAEIQARAGIEWRRVVGLVDGQPVYRLLVVEDVADSRQLLVELLRPLGFEVREATNGQEAIDIWQAWQPHLIWMDLRMPVLDGREATRHIRATPSGQAVTIVALSASAFEEDRAKTLAIGCDDFVRKPFRQAEIFDILTHYLGVRFVYEDSLPPGQTAPTAELTPADLVAMPADWLRDVRQATLEGDLTRLLGLIAQIQDKEPALADQLHKLVDSFNMETLLRLIEQTA